MLLLRRREALAGASRRLLRVASASFISSSPLPSSHVSSPSSALSPSPLLASPRLVLPPFSRCYSSNSSSFGDLGVDDRIAAALSEMGIKAPTSIQEKSISAILARHDVLCTAQTGTGKTLAYLVPVVEQFLRQEAEERLKRQQNASEAALAAPEAVVGRPRALVVVPSRELALQISDVAKQLAHSAKFATTTITSGERKGVQLRSLSRRLDLVVGTPGRLAKCIKNGEFFLSRVNTVVLDEADTLFDAKMGFRKELDAIIGPVQQSAAKRNASLQMILVAATIRSPLDQVLKKKFGDLRLVSASNVHQTPVAVREEFIRVSPEVKHSALREALHLHKQKRAKTIVFCRNAASVRSTEHMLREHGFNHTVCLHGEMPAAPRHEAIEKFSKDDTTNILVCTDLAARGLDFPTVRHVVMFDFPTSAVDYVHRAGRTGRAGEAGLVTSLVTKYDSALATTIENAKRHKNPIKDLRDSAVLAGKFAPSKTDRSNADTDSSMNPRGSSTTRKAEVRRARGVGTKRLRTHKLRTL